MSNDLIHLHVKNLLGARWEEDWSKEKLAYFISMSDLDEPKYDQSQETEWVPFDSNHYKWNKDLLSEEEFNAFAARWPGQQPVTFDPSSCDHVQFNFEVNQKVVGVGFDPQQDPRLFNLIVELGRPTIQYEGFRYAFGRHVFHSELRRESIAAIAKGSSGSLRQISPVLTNAVAFDRLRKLKVISALSGLRDGDVHEGAERHGRRARRKAVAFLLHVRM